MKLIYTSQFKKDFKRISKQGKDLTKLEYVIETLLSNKKLELKFKDHPLSGKWNNRRDVTSNQIGCLFITWQVIL